MRKFQIKELTGKTKVTYLVSGTIEGEQIRKRFATEKEASRFADHHNRLLAARQEAEASPVYTKLTAGQVATAEIMFRYIGDSDPIEVVQLGLKAIREVHKEIPLAETISKFLEAKRRENPSERTLSSLDHRLASLEEAIGNSIDREKIREWINRPGKDGKPRSPRTIINDRAVVYTFFQWCLSHGIVTENPVEAIRRPKAPPVRPRVLSVSEAKALLSAAREKCGGRRVAYFAIAIWAGVRPRELLRLSPQDVDLKRRIIKIEAGQSKVRRAHRFIQIQPNLLSILEGSDIKAGVNPVNFRREFDIIREEAGLLNDWQDDIMRHSFGSYHLENFGDDKATARQMGNSVATIYQHYYMLVAPEEAKAFWEIR